MGTWGRVAWVVGGYLAGTFPSTLVAARVAGKSDLIAAADRRSGEADPHILGVKHMGAAWTTAAGVADVLKGFLFVLAAREWGDLDHGWLALAGMAVVLGHTFPFYARRMAGRGLAAAAGVFLLLLPLEMIVAGLLIVLGAAIRHTGLATSVGLAIVPAAAAVQGQPWQLVAMAGGIIVLIALRRVEGVGDVVRGGVRPSRAVLYRVVFDSSGPPRPRPTA
jgi:acyl phosphate:glycerol-3-phosphate acyltransferase